MTTHFTTLQEAQEALPKGFTTFDMQEYVARVWHSAYRAGVEIGVDKCVEMILPEEVKNDASRLNVVLEKLEALRK